MTSRISQVGAGLGVAKNYLVSKAGNYGEAVQASMKGEGSWHKTLGIILTFILMFAASVALMADNGANITAYTVIVCLLLFPTTHLLVVSNFTKSTRLGRVRVNASNRYDPANGPKTDFLIFVPVYLALILAVAMCIIPMLAFVETDTYANGSTVTPGHSGVQRMDRGQRLGVGITGFLLTLFLFGFYFIKMRKTAMTGAANTKPFVRSYQAARVGAGAAGGAAIGTIVGPFGGAYKGFQGALKNATYNGNSPWKKFTSGAKAVGRGLGGATAGAAAGAVAGPFVGTAGGGLLGMGKSVGGYKFKPYQFNNKMKLPIVPEKFSQGYAAISS